jgi:hypothetical protein
MDHVERTWWTVQELAARTGLHEQTIRWHCRQGNIAAQCTQRFWVISAEAADEFCQDLAQRRLK